ncbi:MAG: serine/threonine protein kinase, partial [Treponema sp.]|nr:serine/threonine protein kinase [Treponema sp.]
ETGKNLTEDTRFFLSYRGKWVLIEEVPPEDIRSGSIIKVLARCDGYDDAVYSLLLDWYQDELIISAAMQKTEEVKK